MKLVELLTPERVLVPLPGGTLHQASDALTHAVVSSGAASDADRVRELIAAAVPGQVVSMGEAFLLHLRTDAVPNLVAALGIAAEPIPRDDDSTKAARIVIVILAPPKEASAYLQALGAFARALARREVVESLLSATSAAAVLAAAPLVDIELPGYLSVRDVMMPRQLSVRPDTTLGEASKLMVAHQVVALPVVSESNELLGMVTHRELLRYLLPVYVKRMSRGDRRSVARNVPDTGDPHKLPVRDVMDRSVLAVSEDQTLAEVATLMVNKNIDRFPVVREGILVGFLTRGDVVQRIFGP